MDAEANMFNENRFDLLAEDLYLTHGRKFTTENKQLKDTQVIREVAGVDNAYDPVAEAYLIISKKRKSDGSEPQPTVADPKVSGSCGKPTSVPLPATANYIEPGEVIGGKLFADNGRQSTSDDLKMICSVTSKSTSVKAAATVNSVERGKITVGESVADSSGDGPQPTVADPKVSPGKPASVPGAAAANHIEPGGVTVVNLLFAGFLAFLVFPQSCAALDGVDSGANHTIQHERFNSQRPVEIPREDIYGHGCIEYDLNGKNVTLVLYDDLAVPLPLWMSKIFDSYNHFSGIKITACPENGPSAYVLNVRSGSCTDHLPFIPRTYHAIPCPAENSFDQRNESFTNTTRYLHQPEESFSNSTSGVPNSSGAPLIISLLAVAALVVFACALVGWWCCRRKTKGKYAVNRDD